MPGSFPQITAHTAFQIFPENNKLNLNWNKFGAVVATFLLFSIDSNSVSAFPFVLISIQYLTLISMICLVYNPAHILSNIYLFERRFGLTHTFRNYKLAKYAEF